MKLSQLIKRAAIDENVVTITYQSNVTDIKLEHMIKDFDGEMDSSSDRGNVQKMEIIFDDEMNAEDFSKQTTKYLKNNYDNFNVILNGKTR